MAAPIAVTAPEAGQKLLQFLARRVEAPQSELHRWIRTGQVRINGGRAKAFDRVREGDLVRVPPFAAADPAGERGFPPCGGHSRALTRGHDAVVILAETDDLLVINKPAGLPTHPGTGHTDSLATRLAAARPDASFRPTPAHRLDRDTSGLILAAKSYAALRGLCEAFAARNGVIKEYLAWVAGACLWDTPRTLEDRLRKSDVASPADTRRRSASGRPRERVQVVSDRHKPSEETAPGSPGRTARLTARTVARINGASLLHIRLYTGRTHQIRAQLAARGFPLIGDVKYGGPFATDGLKLHAFRLTVEGKTWTAAPPWNGVWAVRDMPCADDLGRDDLDRGGPNEHGLDRHAPDTGRQRLI